MSRIQQLSVGVVNKIAAGEVIERPANVVKELLENSIDALASRIEIDILDGGMELIRVVDDGEGIHPDDVLLAVQPHATSKIASADDLFRVHTMGFRGEALASVAEVSQFRIRTRQPEALDGTELEIHCGQIGTPQPCGCPVGTQIEIRQLFSNTPVRRKFMKSTATEFRHITEQFARVALAHPRLHLVLQHNGKKVYELPGTHRLIERLQMFYGSELADKLLWVESETNDVRMWGYVGHPSQSKATRKGQYIFLNGRWIQDRALQHALTEAFRGLLMVGRQPVAFLFIEMPADQVDVNVHPTKVEVRFRDGQSLYRQLLSMLKAGFASADLDSQLKLRDERRPLTPPDPARQRELQMELSQWAREQLTQVQPAEPSGEGQILSGSDALRLRFDAGGHLGPAHTADDNDAERRDPFGEFHTSERPESTDHAQPAASSEHDSPEDSASPPPYPASTSPDPQTLRAALAQQPTRAMQVHDCYLIVETDDGVTVIDQHALHERIMYEQLRNRVLAGSVESQRMLLPETIELNARETALLLEHREMLQQFGFGIEEFGQNTILVNRYPVMLAQANLTQLIRDVADQLEQADGRVTRRDLLDSLLHMMSCKAAIKAGHRLSPEEIETLLQKRHLIDDAHHCPHGRPTALVLSVAELDRQFGRLG